MTDNIRRIYDYLKANGPQTPLQLASALDMSYKEVLECAKSEENNLFWLAPGHKLEEGVTPPEVCFVVRPNIRPCR